MGKIRHPIYEMENAKVMFQTTNQWLLTVNHHEPLLLVYNPIIKMIIPL